MKQCEICKIEYGRKKRMSHKNFEKSRFCSSNCQHKHLSDLYKTDRYQKLLKESMKGNRYALGTVWTDEKKMRLQGRFVGEKSPRWIADRSKLRKYSDDNLDRRSYAYSYWRRVVYKRDGFCCKINNSDCSGRIEAHHILSWKDYPELRFDVNNGITVCKYHHPKKREEEIKSISFFKNLLFNEIQT